MREAEPRTGEYKSWARVCGQDNGDSAAVEPGWKEKHMVESHLERFKSLFSRRGDPPVWHPLAPEEEEKDND